MSSLIIAVLVGIVAAMVFVGRHRGKQIGALAERGVPATATISRRLGRSKVKRIGFTYAGPDGRQYERTRPGLLLSEHEFRRIRPSARAAFQP